MKSMKTKLFLSFTTLIGFALISNAYSASGTGSSSNAADKLKSLSGNKGSTVSINSGARLSTPSLEKIEPKAVKVKPSEDENSHKADDKLEAVKNNHSE